MNDRLEEIERRYDELTQELSRPEVASDPARLRDLGRRHAELQEIVSAARAYREAVRQAEEARSLARQERDPEMVELEEVIAVRPFSLSHESTPPAPGLDDGGTLHGS